MSLDQIAAAAAADARRRAAGVDVDLAMSRVERRYHRGRRMRQGAVAVAVAAAVVLGLVVAPRWLAGPVETVPESPPYRLDLVPSLELSVPDGFEVQRENAWGVEIAPTDGVAPDRPWAGFSVLVPDGVYDHAAGEIRPIPDDLESWVLNVPDVEVLGQRRVTVDGRDAFQYDDHPTYFDNRPYFAVGDQGLPGGTALYRFRTTLVEVDGALVVIGGAVQQKYWPLPDPGTAGDPYEELLDSVRFD